MAREAHLFIVRRSKAAIEGEREMDTLREVFKWIGSHATKLAGAARALFIMGTLLSWWTLTEVQLMGIMGFIEAVLYIFVEANTMSKVRAVQRIEQEVEKRTGTGNGNGTHLPLIALLLLPALLAGCTKSGPVLVTADDAIHDSLLRVKGTGDTLCSAKAPILSEAICREFYTNLTPALEAGAAFNRAARDQKIEGLLNLAGAVSRLVETVRKIPIQHRGAMETNLGNVLRVAAKEQ